MDTDLVSQLSVCGIPQHVAAAFERHLDDYPACGISGVRLGALICVIVRKRCAQYQHAMELQEAIEERRRRTNLDLFQSSMYGTHAPTDEA